MMAPRHMTLHKCKSNDHSVYICSLEILSRHVSSEYSVSSVRTFLSIQKVLEDSDNQKNQDHTTKLLL